jgi:hypothetical protein
VICSDTSCSAAVNKLFEATWSKAVLSMILMCPRNISGPVGVSYDLYLLIRCYGLDDRGFASRQGLGVFLFTTMSRPALGLTLAPVQWVPGTVSLGVKRSVCEADHSPPSSAEVKNAWRCTSISQYVFMAWCLVKYKENFTFSGCFVWV